MAFISSTGYNSGPVAGVAKLVDAPDSKSGLGNQVSVRFRPPAPSSQRLSLRFNGLAILDRSFRVWVRYFGTLPCLLDHRPTSRKMPLAFISSSTAFPSGYVSSALPFRSFSVVVFTLAVNDRQKQGQNDGGSFWMN